MDKKDSPKRIEIFRTKHLLIVPESDPDKYGIFVIPRIYIHLEKKNFGTSVRKEIFKHKNGEILMRPDGIRFILCNVKVYYEEAADGFQKEMKKIGNDVFLEIN